MMVYICGGLYLWMIVWGRGGDYFPRRNHMGLRWFHTSEVWRMGQRLWAYSRISSTLAMLYEVSSGVSESAMLLKCEPKITQSPLSIASFMRFFLSAAVHIATEVFLFLTLKKLA